MVLLDAGRAQREALGWKLCAGHDSGIVMLDDALNRPGEEVEIEDVPGEALILPKRTKKLLVYLDQNFISEMAKAEGNQGVRQEFHDLYQILKTGFWDEKLVVPQSWFHDIETRLAPGLKEQIVRYQNYLGQVRLKYPDRVQQRQIDTALQRFCGDGDADPVSIDIAFKDDPDKHVERYNIIADWTPDLRILRSDRTSVQTGLERLRQRLATNGTSYQEQLQQEIIEHRSQYLRMPGCYYESPERLMRFLESDAFTKVPSVLISASLHARILTERSRTIQSGDSTDIEVLSTFLPYMDVVATDNYMATQLRELGIDERYGVKVFGAKTKSVRSLRDCVSTHLAIGAPANKPLLTVFVLPHGTIKRNSWEFFLHLGNSAKAISEGDYVRLYAFDDGRMPEYEMPPILSGRPLPFYGMQDVTVIKIQPDTPLDEILPMCRRNCQSDQFVIVDKHANLQELFVLGAIMDAEAGRAITGGYHIYQRDE